MSEFKRLRGSVGYVLALAMCAPFATSCAGENLEGSMAEEPIFEEVTDVSHTSVKNQSIGNCWSYAAAAWVESLYRARNNQDLNVSESWITFWDWHQKITAGTGITVKDGRSEVSTGGWWDSAMNTLRTRGVVMEDEFIPEEATADRSSRQSAALAAINTALNEGGALATASARRDPQIVLNTLLEAWQINDNVRAEIRRVFGISARRTVYTTTETNLGIFRKVESLQIRTSVVRNGRVAQYDGTLADVIPGGRYAWRSASYPTDRASRITYQRRVMRALNARQPVIISWLVDFNAMTSRGTFELPMPLATAGRQGGHLTVMEDYQVTIRQPGQPDRSLAAGVVASAADMALAEQYGEMEFIRIKNSWGTARNPSGIDGLGGYHDLYMNYLNGPIQWTEARSQRTPLSSTILPPGF